MVLLALSRVLYAHYLIATLKILLLYYARLPDRKTEAKGERLSGGHLVSPWERGGCHSGLSEPQIHLEAALN